LMVTVMHIDVTRIKTVPPLTSLLADLLRTM
jgi:hypothetical protein